MPKLRTLSGREVMRILEQLDFRLSRTKGSHFLMEYVGTMEIDGVKRKVKKTISVPVHTNQQLSLGILRSIYRDAREVIPADELAPFFYTE